MAAKQKPQSRPAPKAAPLTRVSEKASGERRRLAEGYETRADLYAEAKRRGIEGRSKMTKAELRDALKNG